MGKKKRKKQPEKKPAKKRKFDKMKDDPRVFVARLAR
jgi:hypothetical protein